MTRQEKRGNIRKYLTALCKDSGVPRNRLKADTLGLSLNDKLMAVENGYVNVSKWEKVKR